MSGELFVFKIVVGGAGGVGKTTLLHRYMHDVFKSDTKLTVGVTMQTKGITHDGRKITLVLWDLGGQDQFRFLQPSFCKGALAGIVFFDLTRFDTMLQVKDWVAMFRKHATPGIPIILAGTKLDDVNPGKVEEVMQVAKETATQLGLTICEPTSSKTGEGVAEIFKRVVDILVGQSRGGKEKPSPKRRPGITS